MRILKWIGIVSLPIVLLISYMFIFALRSGWWLDRTFQELSHDWSAEVIIRNAAPTKKTDTPQGLQLALNDLKQAKLEETTNAACTHGPNYVQGEGLDFRSRCLLWAKFDKGVVRFEFELKGSWNQWKITNFSFLPEAPNAT